LRIGLADKTLVVALAHAIVLKDIGELQPIVYKIEADYIGDKKLAPEKLAAKLEKGAEMVKAVYRYAESSIIASVS
jgi:DNA ligase-1